jgi:hypothetical protein
MVYGDMFPLTIQVFGCYSAINYQRLKYKGLIRKRPWMNKHFEEITWNKSQQFDM